RGPRAARGSVRLRDATEVHIQPPVALGRSLDLGQPLHVAPGERIRRPDARAGLAPNDDQRARPRASVDRPVAGRSHRLTHAGTARLPPSLAPSFAPSFASPARA